MAGEAFYNDTYTAIVSNDGFTKAEQSLAESADAILISDTKFEG